MITFLLVLRGNKNNRMKNWFGISATICFDLFELPGACMFVPVQRIACRCAYAVLPIEIGTVTEKLFIA